MSHIERAMTAAAALQRKADAFGVERITTADREAAGAVGEHLAGYLWAQDREVTLRVAAQVRATGSGFALALAEWLERWVGEEQG